MSFQNLTRATLILSSLMLLSCSSSKNSDPKQTVTDLFRAWNQRQEQVVRGLLTDDVQMTLMGQTFKGKDEIVRFMDFDDGMGGQVELGSSMSQGDTVTFELRESNQFMTALGVPQITNYVQFTLANGKVQRSIEVKPPLGNDQLEAAGARFGAWVQSQHPEALSALYGPEGSPVISKEAGILMVKLAKEWSASQSGK